MNAEQNNEKVSTVPAPKMTRQPKSNLIIAAILATALAVVIAGAFLLMSTLSPNDELLTLTEGGTSALVGEIAPDFEFLSEQGHKLRLSDFEGTPIVLNFWASWCPPCRLHMPHFQEAHNLYGNEVKFIMLNFNESMDEARSYIDAEGYAFDIFFDEQREGATAYGVTAVPETFFIDASGIVTASYLGPINLETIEQSIRSMLE